MSVVSRTLRFAQAEIDLVAWESNLLLSDTTHALLGQHLGFMAHHKILDSSVVTTDNSLINQAFPKLELLAITDASGFTRLTIYSQ